MHLNFLDCQGLNIVHIETRGKIEIYVFTIWYNHRSLVAFNKVVFNSFKIPDSVYEG